MKNYLYPAIVIFILSTPVCASRENIQATYLCKSKEVGTDQFFTGHLTVKKTGATYTTTSKFSDGSSYKGTGIYDSKSRILATVAVNPEVASEVGIALYRILKDGSMKGQWTYLHRADVSSAYCQKEK